MVILAIVISYFLYWAANNVCKHNMLLDKKSNMLDEIKDANDYTGNFESVIKTIKESWRVK